MTAFRADITIEIAVWCSRCAEGMEVISQEIIGDFSVSYQDVRRAAKRIGYRKDRHRLWVCGDCWTNPGAEQ